MPSSAEAASTAADAGRTLAARRRALLGLGAARAASACRAAALDWQPALASSEPWRAWSAAIVHYSALHLAANLAGIALVAALGFVAARAAAQRRSPGSSPGR